MEDGLLSILERERKALLKMRFYGDDLMNARRRQMDTDNEILKSYYEERCQYYIDKRNEGLAELNSARDDIKAYFEYYVFGGK